MTRWIGIVLAVRPPGGDEMGSRLATYLHPVAGRPLLWHAVAAVAASTPAPERVLVIGDEELPADLLQDVPVPLQILERPQESGLPDLERQLGPLLETNILVVDGCASLDAEALTRLRGGSSGGWLGATDAEAAAAWLSAEKAAELFRLAAPLSVPNGVLASQQRVHDVAPSLVVRSRSDLAAVTRRVRDRLVQQLMRGGVSFLLPESVIVDIDVRIGRDSVIYPGVVLEGQTTIGEETVVGPGCRIINSWIGSGVELKGWNYVSHTSIRNRAILEPYVRRGFD